MSTLSPASDPNAWLSAQLAKMRERGIDDASLLASLGQVIRGEALQPELAVFTDELMGIAWRIFIEMPQGGRTILVLARLGGVLEGRESLESILFLSLLGPASTEGARVAALHGDELASELRRARPRMSEFESIIMADVLAADWFEPGPDRDEALRRLAVLAPGQRMKLWAALRKSRRAFLKTGRVERLAAGATTAIAIAPDYFEPYVFRASVAEYEGRFEDAKADFAHALMLAPKSPFVFEKRALFRRRVGDLAGAVADLDEALRLEPASHLFLLRGEVRLDSDQAEHAIEDFSRCIEIDRDSRRAYYLRAVAYGSLGDWTRSLADSEFVLREPPPALLHAASLHCRATARAWLGNLDGALSDWQAAMALEPAMVGLYVSRAMHSHRNEAGGGAWADALTAMFLDPELTRAVGGMPALLELAEARGAWASQDAHGWGEAVAGLEANARALQKVTDPGGLIDAARARIRAFGEKSSRRLQLAALRKLRLEIEA